MVAPPGGLSRLRGRAGHRFVLPLIVAAATTACSLPGAQRAFTVVLTRPDPAPPLTVTVVDTVGVVRAVSTEEVAAEGSQGSDLSVQNAVGRPDALVLRWVGGACDLAARVEFGPPPAGDRVLAVQLATTEAPAGCDDVGVGRQILVLLTRPVDADLVVSSVRP